MISPSDTLANEVRLVYHRTLLEQGFGSEDPEMREALEQQLHVTWTELEEPDRVAWRAAVERARVGSQKG